MKMKTNMKQNAKRMASLKVKAKAVLAKSKALLKKNAPLVKAGQRAVAKMNRKDKRTAKKSSLKKLAKKIAGERAVKMDRLTARIAKVEAQIDKREKKIAVLKLKLKQLSKQKGGKR
jgi:glutaminase